MISLVAHSFTNCSCGVGEVASYDVVARFAYSGVISSLRSKLLEDILLGKLTLISEIGLFLEKLECRLFTFYLLVLILKVIPLRPLGLVQSYSAVASSFSFLRIRCRMEAELVTNLLLSIGVCPRVIGVFDASLALLNLDKLLRRGVLDTAHVDSVLFLFITSYMCVL